MDVPDLHRRAVDSFGERVRLIGDDQWHMPTPCSDWDVRDLVHHLTYEAAWTPAMFAGMTIAEAGDRFEGDLLGHEPQQAWERVSAPAVAAVNEPGAMQRTVHLSFGDFSGEFYAGQLFAD
ncbi:MAG TPA: maleylpyruvate isomerase family mycothiol-dependent enzyme, partial [Egibacteraceae bacterium]|nr:maleylpyruvate isomerase family mycothiol-dependent enzyme [Egibacteraceae bacterium]